MQKKRGIDVRAAFRACPWKARAPLLRVWADKRRTATFYSHGWRDNRFPDLGEDLMTIGGSIFLIAVGAILYFATNLHVAHVSIDTVGLILMIAGAAGLVLGLLQQAMWSRRSRRDVVVEERRDPRDPPAY
jgi:hypothetical protein